MIMTALLRDVLQTALIDAIVDDEPRGRAAHAAYLVDVLAFPVGSVIPDGSPVYDVVEYFAVDQNGNRA